MFGVGQDAENYFISKEVARRKMARLKSNTNIILINSVDDINSIPLIVDYKTSYGTVIPEMTMATNDLCTALVSVSRNLAKHVKKDFQTCFNIVKNAVFSNNTSDGFPMAVQSVILLQVQYEDKCQKGTAKTVLDRLEDDINTQIISIAGQMYREKITGVVDPFQSILIRFPDATGAVPGDAPVQDFSGGNRAIHQGRVANSPGDDNNTPRKKLRFSLG